MTAIIALRWVFLFAVLSLCGCATLAPAPSLVDAGQVISRGEAKEGLTEMEAKAVEAERGRNWVQAAQLYNVAARLAETTGQLQKAISYANKGLEVAEKARDLDLQVQAIYFLAVIHRTLRQYEKEREWTERGIKLVEELSTSRQVWESQFHRLLGSEFLRKGEYREAIDHFNYSLQLAESRLSSFARVKGRVSAPLLYDGVHVVILSLVPLAQAYQRGGNVEQAIITYQRGIDLIRQFQARTPAELTLYQGLGRLYLSQRDFPQALENLQRAMELAENQQQMGTVSSTSSLIGDVLRQTGKPAEAITYYQRAVQLTESTRSLLQSQEYRQSFFEGGLGAYVSVINVLLQMGRPEDAFNYSERARSRSFLDVLGNKVQLARNGRLMEQERALQARISVLRAMMEGRGDASEASDLRKQLADAEQDYNEYLTTVRKDNKEQASLMSVEPLTIQQVQERLGPGITLLEYFVSGNNVWLWVIEKDRVEFVSTALARKDLVSKLTELRDTIYQLNEKERFNALSQELHKLLIQPALPHIRGKELIIVPHDVLHYLPFQALLGSDNRYLIEKYPIYYLSSASLMQFTQEKRRAMGQKVLAFGNPDLDDPQMALRFAEIEAGEIKKLYPQANVLLKKEATEEKAKTLSPQNDIIHFASHAELNEDDPLASAILLAKSDKEDGRLEVREIFGMDLKASLIVLSACETGLGKLSSGDELVGLTRAFIYAGTPSVVASLWNVEDSSTAQLMASFYKNLKTMPKADALRQAQLNLIRGNVNSELLARRGIGGVGKLGETPSAIVSGPSAERSAAMTVSTSHPFFWAPFVLVGEGK